MTVLLVLAMATVAALPAVAATHTPGNFSYTGAVVWLWDVNGTPLADAGVLTISYSAFTRSGSITFHGSHSHANCDFDNTRSSGPAGGPATGHLSVAGGLITDGCDELVFGGFHDAAVPAACHALVQVKGSFIFGQSASTPAPSGVGPGTGVCVTVL